MSIMRWRTYLLLVACALFALAPSVRAEAPTGYTMKSRQTADYYATVSALFLYDDYSDEGNVARFEETWLEVKALLETVERAASVADPESDIARFNALGYGEHLSISNHTAAILQIARQIYDQTGGLYDPTVYPLVDLWGFSSRFNTNEYAPEEPYDRAYADGKLPRPSDRYIRAFAQLVVFSGVELTGDDEGGYTLTKYIEPVAVDGIDYQAQLDLGGIAKGYAADLVAVLLRARGYTYGHFVCGGSSMAMLKCASNAAQENGTLAYELGIRKPRAGRGEDSSFLKLRAADTTLSSSGDYSHNYRCDGVLYCHVIDPRTGYPINMPENGVQKGVAAVTVLGENAAYNDAMTTALCVMGGEAAMAYMNAHLRDVPVVIALYSDASDRYDVITNMREEDYRLIDDAYCLTSYRDANGDVVYTGSILP